MLGRVATIALNTYRESVRARILLGLAGVALAISLYSIVVGAFTLRNAPRVVSDIGTASMSLFAVAVAVLISATSLHRELEQKTIFPILARPIHRGEYLLGKYLGTLLTIGVFVLADAAVVLLIGAGLAGRSPALVLGLFFGLSVAFGAAAWRHPPLRTYGPIPWAAALMVSAVFAASVAPDERRLVLGATLLTFAEVMIVAGVATAFASFSTPFLSALMTLGVWLVGRNCDSLARMPARYVGETVRAMGAAVARVWPNLQVYVPPRPLLTGENPDVELGPYLGLALLKAGCWAVLLLTGAVFIFRRRDFL